MKINRSALLKFSAFVLLVGAWMLFGGDAGAMELAPLGLLGGFVVETGIDWEKFARHRNNPEAIKALARNITEFFKEPTAASKRKLAAQSLLDVLKEAGVKFTVPDSNLTGPKPVVSTYANTAMDDYGYERLFEFVDMRQSTSETFDLLDITNGVTFTQLKKGEPIKVRSITTATANVGYLKYGAGLGFLDDWFRFNKYYLMDDILRDVRAKYYDTMSQDHYALFAALSSAVNQAFATDDVTTINNACAQIIKDCNALGFAVGENPVFKIAAGSGLKARIAKALAAGFAVPNSNNNQVVYRIDEVVATPKLADTSYYVVLPGKKLKRAVWDDLNAESQRDALRRAEDMTWEGKYNGAIGEAKQVRRCALS